MIVLRILIVTAAYQKLEEERVTDYLHLFARELKKRGHVVKVIAAHAPEVPIKTNFDGVEGERFVYFWPKSMQSLAYGSGIVSNMLGNPLALLQWPGYMVSGVLKVNKVIGEFKPDVVHAFWAFPQGMMCAFVKNFKSFPLVVSVVGTEAYLAKKYGFPWLVSIPINASDFCASNSSATKSKAVECGAKNKIKVILWGSDTSNFSLDVDGSKKRKELGFKKGDFMIASVGRLVERKGQEYLIEAMKDICKKIPSAKLVLLGDGPQLAKLKKLAKDIGVGSKVSFLGRKPHTELPEYYAASDLFVITSITDKRGVAEGGPGLVTKEAMLIGKPVIGTNCGGIPDLVKNMKTGLLVDQKSSSQLAKAVIKMLSNKKFRDKLAKKGREAALEKASLQYTINEYEKAYSSVAKKRI